MNFRTLVGTAVLAIASALPCPVWAAPKLEVSTVWNFGEIYQWTEPETLIAVKNTGDQDLKITDIKPSCGCTAVFMQDKVIKPGASGNLKIHFLSYNFSGRVRKEVILYTNDPASPTMIIDIKGLIKPDQAGVGAVEPDYRDLGVVAPYETRFFVVLIKNLGNKDLRVLGINLPKGCFLDVSPPERIIPRGEVPVKIGFKPTGPGPIEGEVVVKMDGGGEKEHNVQLAGYVADIARTADSLVVTPTVFRLNQGQSAPMELAIKNDGKGQVIIDSADSSLDGEVKVMDKQELMPGETATVGLTVKPEAVKAGAKGYLYLRIAVPIEVEGETGKKQQ
ncbi:MAG TPA: DUF1573 domain-containing protein [Nitrospirota bacterium]